MVRIYSLVLVYLLGLLLPYNAYKSSATAFQLIATRNEERSLLVGEWKVVTKVVWSDCDYVDPGVETESKIYIHDINGKLFPEWDANDWQLVRDTEINFNYDDSFHWERESMLEEDDKFWYVETVNDFEFDEFGHLIGKGQIRQYLNGEFVGSYITESQLVKVF